MKGFGIEVKNNLLEPKHIEAMGISVWLYMWCLDKMTSISEDGVGKVLSGRSIKYHEVFLELGIAERTYQRWVKNLSEKKYINVERAVDGLRISVNKAHKYFGKKTSDTPKMSPETTKVAERGDKSGGSSIYNTQNNTIQELPIWVNKNAWGAWEKYNRERKKRLTPSTRAFQLKKLEKYKSTHAEMIYQSIEKNWLGLFPIAKGFENSDARQVLRKRAEDIDAQKEREISAGDDEARKKINKDMEELNKKMTTV